MECNFKAHNASLRSVPRSRGCITCVSRKTRCDGRRPACEACEKRKKTCGGYRRGDFIFMNEGWRAPGVAAPEKTTKLELVKSIDPDPLPNYVCFFLAQFTINPPPEGKAMIESCHRYLSLLLMPSSLVDDNDPLPHAARALVMNYFGKLNASRQLVHDSVSAYVRALRSLSARVASIQRIGIDTLEEEDVMQTVFSCLFLTFWELTTEPQGATWQKHVRGLANLIKLRGPQGFKSVRSLQVVTLVRILILLESISTKQATFFAQPEWRGFRCFRPRPLPWYSDPGSDGDGRVESTGPLHYLDFIFDQLITVSDVTTGFARSLEEQTKTNNPNRSVLPSLRQIQIEYLPVLKKLELVLTHMIANIGGSLADAVLTTAPLGSSIKGPFWGKPIEYNLSSVCRTAAVTLRLLICDIGKYQQQLGSIETEDHAACLAENRAALMAHAQAIVNTIPYSLHASILGATPFCFVPAFRIAKTVLARESETLQAEGGTVGAVAKCAEMDSLIQRHLDFVGSLKIPIKLDI